MIQSKLIRAESIDVNSCQVDAFEEFQRYAPDKINSRPRLGESWRAGRIIRTTSSGSSSAPRAVNMYLSTGERIKIVAGQQQQQQQQQQQRQYQRGSLARITLQRKVRNPKAAAAAAAAADDAAATLR
uniref:Uncharacterized protein n=1 Tax=Trichogramma kaykai TaxID=54128 RepID=A0ABD2W0K0_9HYME